MTIKQFKDKDLAHYAYALVSDGEMALIDPARNPEPYYRYAEETGAKIVAVIETHPHADFISGHMEIHLSQGADIYASTGLGADYPHKAFNEGDVLALGKASLKALDTPGHSPDSISILAVDETGKEVAVFTGDSLFIGDCGRPDLREKAGAIHAKREELARQMYHTLRNKFIPLPDTVKVYPAHGAGSLCGKGMSDQDVSTIGAEKMSNWSLQPMAEAEFVEQLLKDQPFVPKYFPYAVGVNKKGAEPFAPAIRKVPFKAAKRENLEENIMLIDSRAEADFKRGHLEGAINLMINGKFETWLGSIVAPEEAFYLIVQDEQTGKALMERVAKIGYEPNVKAVLVGNIGDQTQEVFEADQLRHHPSDYTIVDIRNASETAGNALFEGARHIPLHQLRERADELPVEKPIVVHCAGGYRSAAGSSIIKARLNGKVHVYDLSEAVKTFQT